MDEINEKILEDISKCKELIKNNYATKEDLDGFIAKYHNIYPNFGSNITYHAEAPGYKPNYISKIMTIENELEGLLLTSKIRSNNDIPNKTENHYYYNYNNNQNNIENNINITFEDLIKQIENDNHIPTSDKQEILNKIEDLRNIRNEKSDKSSKWNKIKPILIFLLDKGADVVITYLPGILLLIKQIIGG